MLARHAHIVLYVSYSQLPRLERFVADRISDPLEARRMTILCTELFDNIVSHARGVCPAFVWIRISSGAQSSLRMVYHARNFGELVSTLRSRLVDKLEGKPATAPRFDPAANRYRGLGLTMCTANARDITARTGLFWNVLSVVL